MLRLQLNYQSDSRSTTQQDLKYTTYEGMRRTTRKLTFELWRAVRAGQKNIFTAAFWSAITGDSSFMLSNFRKQSVIKKTFKD